MSPVETAALERVAADRDAAREMLAEAGRENARLRVELAAAHALLAEWRESVVAANRISQGFEERARKAEGVVARARAADYEQGKAAGLMLAAWAIKETSFAERFMVAQWLRDYVDTVLGETGGCGVTTGGPIPPDAPAGRPAPARPPLICGMCGKTAEQHDQPSDTDDHGPWLPAPESEERCACGHGLGSHQTDMPLNPRAMCAGNYDTESCPCREWRPGSGRAPRSTT